MSGPLRVLDIVNTDHAALNFLAYRVGWINRHTEFRNDIVCSAGPHLPRVHAEGARVTALPIPRDLAPVPCARLVLDLVRHLRAHRYTIVHTHNSVTGAAGRVAARLARTPLVIHTTHGFHFHEHMTGVRRATFVTAERWLARYCDLLLCQNREELAEARALGFRPRQGIDHVGNGIDLRRFAARPAPPANRRPVLLCSGRLEPVKNQGMLFRALRRLADRTSNPPLLRLVGDGPLRAAYEEEVRRAGIGHLVEFLGYRYDLPQLLADTDVAVLTSVKEGIPRALMEAMAVGVPVVATNVKGTREVVAPGMTGFLVPLGDVDALTDRIAELLASPALCRDMGARGVDFAREHCDEALVAERLARTYRVALRGQGLSVVKTRTPRPLHTAAQT